MNRSFAVLTLLVASAANAEGMTRNGASTTPGHTNPSTSRSSTGTFAWRALFTPADVFVRSEELEKVVVDYCMAELGRKMDQEPDRDSLGTIVRSFDQAQYG